MKQFMKTMKARGFVHQATFDVDDRRDKHLRAYIGFDLTAPSLHVGSLIQIMVLRHLIDHGHEAVILLGDATTRVGDPTGRDAARPVLTGSNIIANKEGIRRSLETLIPKASFQSNADWFGGEGAWDTGTTFMSFVTEHGPHFSVNRLLTMETISRRLINGSLSFLEFCYVLMQAVDFLELSRRLGVNMQIGGSDQWGNIVNGLELIRRADGIEAMAFTTPLLTDRAGNKIGKSQGKPVWLRSDMTSDFDFFQFWRNVADEDVERFLKLFTFLDISLIEKMMAGDINAAKKNLAFEVTRFVRGEEAATEAAKQAGEMFEQGIVPNLPIGITVPEGTTLIEAMIASNLAPSNSQAKRLLAQNAVSIDGKKVSDNIPIDSELVLAVGKKAPIKIGIDKSG